MSQEVELAYEPRQSSSRTREKYSRSIILSEAKNRGGSSTVWRGTAILAVSVHERDARGASNCTSTIAAGMLNDFFLRPPDPITPLPQLFLCGDQLHLHCLLLPLTDMDGCSAVLERFQEVGIGVVRSIYRFPGEDFEVAGGQTQ